MLRHLFDRRVDFMRTRMAEDAWNTRDPARVALAYTTDSRCGLMRLRIASINDLPIRESERKYHWPLGRRPDDHPSLSDLGL
jgi:nuclear transport factor 2 (NTF2) superfamily protein